MSIDGIEDPHFDFAAGFNLVLQVYLLSLLLELLMDQLVLEIPIQLLDILSWRRGTSLRKLKASLMASFSLCLSQVMRNPAPWSSYSLGSIQKQKAINNHSSPIFYCDSHYYSDHCFTSSSTSSGSPS